MKLLLDELPSADKIGPDLGTWVVDYPVARQSVSEKSPYNTEVVANTEGSLAEKDIVVERKYALSAQTAEEKAEDRATVRKLLARAKKIEDLCRSSAELEEDPLKAREGKWKPIGQEENDEYDWAVTLFLPLSQDSGSSSASPTVSELATMSASTSTADSPVPDTLPASMLPPIAISTTGAVVSKTLLPKSPAKGSRAPTSAKARRLAPVAPVAPVASIASPVPKRRRDRIRSFLGAVKMKASKWFAG